MRRPMTVFAVVEHLSTIEIGAFGLVSHAKLPSGVWSSWVLRERWQEERERTSFSTEVRTRHLAVDTYSTAEKALQALEVLQGTDRPNAGGYGDCDEGDEAHCWQSRVWTRCDCNGAEGVVRMKQYKGHTDRWAALL